MCPFPFLTEVWCVSIICAHIILLCAAFWELIKLATLKQCIPFWNVNCVFRKGSRTLNDKNFGSSVNLVFENNFPRSGCSFRCQSLFSGVHTFLLLIDLWYPYVTHLQAYPYFSPRLTAILFQPTLIPIIVEGSLWCWRRAVQAEIGWCRCFRFFCEVFGMAAQILAQ